MKKSVLIVLLAMCLGMAGIFAQGRQKPENRMKKEKMEMKAEKKKLTPEERADRMAKKLNLTDQEKSEVTALFHKSEKEHMKRMKEGRNRTEASKMDRESARKAHNAELEKIIGKEKFQQLEKMRADHRRDGKRDYAHAGKGRVHKPHKNMKAN